MNLESSWFFRPNALENPKALVFCFPYAGGDAYVFKEWHKYMPDGVELIALQYPGRSTRIGEAPFRSLADLINQVAHNIMSVVEDTPYFIWGHSNGALVSYELVKHLENTNAPLPLHIFLGAKTPPCQLEFNPNFEQLDDDYFIDLLRGYELMPEELFENSDFLDYYLPIFKTDVSLSEKYQPLTDKKSSVSATVINGVNDTHVDQSALHLWKNHFSSEINFFDINSGHFFINSDREILSGIISNQIVRNMKNLTNHSIK